MNMLTRRPRSGVAREARHLRAVAEGDFGEPSTYSLTERELRRHVADLWRRWAWQEWELRARFGRWAA
jgi:hypothetical protein